MVQLPESLADIQMSPCFQSQPPSCTDLQPVSLFICKKIIHEKQPIRVFNVIGVFIFFPPAGFSFYI